MSKLLAHHYSLQDQCIFKRWEKIPPFNKAASKSYFKSYQYRKYKKLETFLQLVYFTDNISLQYRIQLANLLIFRELSKTSQRLYDVLIIQNLDYLDIFCVNIFNKYSHDVYSSLSRMKCF